MSRYTSYQDRDSRNFRGNNQNSYQGRLPNGWLNCPEYADDLLADFILPVKVPLHRNYRNKTTGQNWEVNDVIKLQDTYGLGFGKCKCQDLLLPVFAWVSLSPFLEKKLVLSSILPILTGIIILMILKRRELSIKNFV